MITLLHTNLLFCFAKKITKKGARNRYTTCFREGVWIELCATAVNSSGSLIGLSMEAGF